MCDIILAMSEGRKRRYSQVFERKSEGYHRVFIDIKSTDRIAARPDHEFALREVRKDLITSIGNERDSNMKKHRERELKNVNKSLHRIQQALMARYS
jgi:hypothetical protein